VARLIWSPDAINDLESIYEFIAKDSERFARIFASRIIQIVESIPDYPMRGRKVPEIGEENVREIFYKLYRIIYWIHTDRIEILNIIHEADI